MLMVYYKETPLISKLMFMQIRELSIMYILAYYLLIIISITYNSLHILSF